MKILDRMQGLLSRIMADEFDRKMEGNMGYRPSPPSAPPPPPRVPRGGSISLI
jgi:hypothetical protein